MALGAVALLIQDELAWPRPPRPWWRSPWWPARSCSRAPRASPRRRSPSPGWAPSTPPSRASCSPRTTHRSSAIPWRPPGGAALVAGPGRAGRPGRGPHPGDPAGRGRRHLPGHRAGDAGGDLRPGHRAHHHADPRGHGRQRLPVDGARRHRHHRRPALLHRGHHRRPRRDRPARSAPTRGSRTRSWSRSRRRSACCWCSSRRSRSPSGCPAPSSRSCAAWSSCSAPASTAPAPRCWSAWCPASSGCCRSAISMLWLHPDWRPTAAVALAATGAVLLALTLLPSAPSVRRGRFGDIAESVCLLSLLPLLVLATGSSPPIRGGSTDGHQEGPRRGLLVQPAPPGHGVRLRRARRTRGRARAARPHHRRRRSPWPCS